jgi:hypothetical protein
VFAGVIEFTFTEAQTKEALKKLSHRRRVTLTGDIYSISTES